MTPADPRRSLIVPGLGRIDPTVRGGWRAYRDGWPLPVARPGEFPAGRASWCVNRAQALRQLKREVSSG